MNYPKRRIPLRRLAALLTTLALMLALPLAMWARTDIPSALAEAASTSADSYAASSSSQATPEYSSLEELAGKRFCAVLGSVAPQYVEEAIGKQDFEYYQSVPDCLMAVAAGKADAFTVDRPIGEYGLTQVDGLTIMEENFSSCDYAICLPMNSPYESDFSRLLEQMEQDGTLDALYEKWTTKADNNPIVQDWEGTAGTIVYELDPTKTPMSFADSAGNPMGYEPEVVFSIARELNLNVEMRYTQFASLLADLEANKADAVTSAIGITEERQQKVTMLKDGSGGIACVVRATGGSASDSSAGTSKDSGFFSDVASSFERTFVTESRWAMVLAGLGVTIAITVASGTLGAALGFALCLAQRRGGKVAHALISAFDRLMGGLPVVVVLMVLYYVAFGALDLPGAAVSVVGFTLIFGAASHSIMQAGIDSVDPGQEEGALALGYSRAQAFHKVVFPQAARQFMPVLSGELVGLLKNTSVVGYIAVEDLTRVSDLIRARTMEAFFPLIATAVIYFALAQLIALLMGRVAARLDRQNRPRTLKGVVSTTLPYRSR
ncbi:MAG: ABC transporter substrate-binding protein/permease [Coriobacteriales bacterium]|nr:ABC transporter substrate-binding protein/permease [Coriobacteriales bacterium]